MVVIAYHKSELIQDWHGADLAPDQPKSDRAGSRLKIKFFWPYAIKWLLQNFIWIISVKIFTIKKIDSWKTFHLENIILVFYLYDCIFNYFALCGPLCFSRDVNLMLHVDPCWCVSVGMLTSCRSHPSLMQMRRVYLNVSFVEDFISAHIIWHLKQMLKVAKMAWMFDVEHSGLFCDLEPTSHWLAHETNLLPRAWLFEYCWWSSDYSTSLRSHLHIHVTWPLICISKAPIFPTRIVTVSTCLPFMYW